MMFLGLRKLGNICCGHKMFLNKIKHFCVPDTKFVSATNVARAGKRGNIYVDNNAGCPQQFPRLPGPLKCWHTRTHCCRHKCFPVCPRAQHLLQTQILWDAQKCFWFCSETFSVRSKCFPVCVAQETSWATMCPTTTTILYLTTLHLGAKKRSLKHVRAKTICCPK